MRSESAINVIGVICDFLEYPHTSDWGYIIMNYINFRYSLSIHSSYLQNGVYVIVNKC